MLGSAQSSFPMQTSVAASSQQDIPKNSNSLPVQGFLADVFPKTDPLDHNEAKDNDTTFYMDPASKNNDIPPKNQLQMQTHATSALTTPQTSNQKGTGKQNAFTSSVGKDVQWKTGNSQFPTFSSSVTTAAVGAYSSVNPSNTLEETAFLEGSLDSNTTHQQQQYQQHQQQQHQQQQHSLS